MVSSSLAQSPPKAVAKRALEEEPDGGRCLLQNSVDNDPEAVLPCYVIPKELEKDHKLMSHIHPFGSKTKG
ncbi:hypothetical protein CC2G_008236 [Coprinopsis cinerea AmutBmut pab1-1]|nr:hypothetical protein CC2G_008236 [Coprinopsis cinerea AmutBmut pab1-1]